MTSNNPSTLPNSGRGPSARFSARYLRALEARRAVAREEVAAIVGGYHPDRVILFGSLARGDSWDGSDVDLLIVKSTATGRLLDRMDEVLRHTSGRTHVEPLVYTEAELAQMVAQGNPLILQALKEGEVLYDRQQPDQR
ncbi:nucleotidyltransferase domain-containing protein [bacterium]|nr:nucleotidyltransferase domain-containing protein [bacterium]NDK17376.1 nucleotidyltransferase domain-containing protein [Armatimonadota bacterium]PIY38585.1 MAG: hypothetical protein COZ06_30955 [Armatimonadetes bacterium CG_4_10_14_3_um_filter_66_18]